MRTQYHVKTAKAFVDIQRMQLNRSDLQKHFRTDGKTEANIKSRQLPITKKIKVFKRKRGKRVNTFQRHSTKILVRHEQGLLYPVSKKTGFFYYPIQAYLYKRPSSSKSSLPHLPLISSIT